jgi:hypothetical protein
MRALNAAVDLERRDVAAVVREFLARRVWGRLGCMSEPDRFGHLQPCGAQQPLVEHGAMLSAATLH